MATTHQTNTGESETPEQPKAWTLQSLWPPLVFVATVGLHCWFLTHLGRPSPGNTHADTNVYLELAQNLFRDGSYGTRVSVTYPPGYPMFLAPMFGIADNTARFSTIYMMHGVVMALCSLALLPLLRDSLGRTKGWLALALLQCLGALLYHGYVTQTEGLFLSLLMAAGGFAWMAWSRPGGRAWIGLGLFCGLAVCTKRTGLVLPVALALLMAHDTIAALREKSRLPLRRVLLIALGFLLGLLPELFATYLHEGYISPYSGGRTGPARGHLRAGLIALDSLDNLKLFVQVAVRHVAYLNITTFSGLIVISAVLWGRGSQPQPQLPRPLSRFLGFVGYTSLGLVAMTTLHIARYRYGRPHRPGWDIYARYVDPVEPLLVVAAVVGATWWLRNHHETGWPRIKRVLPWVLINGLFLALSGPIHRPRSARVPHLSTLHDYGFSSEVAPWVVPIFGGLVLTLWVLVWARLRAGTLTLVALAVVVSQLMSMHSPVSRITNAWSEDRAPDVLKLKPLREEPDAPLAVLVRKVGKKSRRYYLPAFRSNHEVFFLHSERELAAWMEENPRGFALTRRKDPKLKWRQVAKTAKWRVYKRP
ncbi:MAG: hypothetical protein CL928_19040 [Deltaproteobacteria bacterium]|nr:hypothetical protein [Deltaproteobacteria bacterium]